MPNPGILGMSNTILGLTKFQVCACAILGLSAKPGILGMSSAILGLSKFQVLGLRVTYY